MKDMISRYIKWKVLAPFVVTAIIGALVVGGIVTAVAISTTTQEVEGARALTTDITEVTVTHLGIRVAASGDVEASPPGIVTADDTDATAAVVSAATVATGDFIYEIKFESTNNDDVIPNGTITIRWLGASGGEETETIVVTGVTPGGGAKAGFTVVVPGDNSNTPTEIQLIWEGPAA